MSIHYLRGLSPQDISAVAERAYSMIQRGQAECWSVGMADNGARFVMIERPDDDGEPGAWHVSRADDGEYAILNSLGRPIAAGRSLSTVLARLP